MTVAANEILFLVKAGRKDDDLSMEETVIVNGIQLSIEPNYCSRERLLEKVLEALGVNATIERGIVK
jgi:hypothetical protein